MGTSGMALCFAYIAAGRKWSISPQSFKRIGGILRLLISALPLTFAWGLRNGLLINVASVVDSQNQNFLVFNLPLLSRLFCEIGACIRIGRSRNRRILAQSRIEK